MKAGAEQHEWYTKSYKAQQSISSCGLPKTLGKSLLATKQFEIHAKARHMVPSKCMQGPLGRPYRAGEQKMQPHLPPGHPLTTSCFQQAIHTQESPMRKGGHVTQLKILSDHLMKIHRTKMLGESKACSLTHLVHIGVVLGAGFKESDPKLVCQCLAFAGWHSPLALIHVTFVSNQDLKDPTSANHECMH